MEGSSSESEISGNDEDALLNAPVIADGVSLSLSTGSTELISPESISLESVFHSVVIGTFSLFRCSTASCSSLRYRSKSIT